jgi:protein-arginine deiminase
VTERWHDACLSSARRRDLAPGDEMTNAVRPAPTGGWRWAAAIVAIGASAACSRTSDGSGSDLGRPALLVVDANRDGLLDVSGLSDEVGRTSFDADAGGVVLPNLDDDDSDRKADASVAGVQGDADVLDLSPVAVRALPTAPDGATGLLTVDAGALPHVHFFSVMGPEDRASSYSPIELPATLSTSVLRSGARLAVEVNGLLGATGDRWDGTVHLSLGVNDAKGALLLTDAARLRVAPLVFQWNTLPTRRVFHFDAAPDTDSLVEGITPLIDAGVVREGIRLPARAADQWAQDYFEVAHLQRPGPDGTVDMRVVVRSAQPDRLAGAAMSQRIGPDTAVAYVHGPLQNDASGSGYSMSSFGNWEVVPPYRTEQATYPLGRHIWGSGTRSVDQPDPTFVAFVRAQGVQPPLTVDTNWLTVGHVDEIFSFVRSPGVRGWRVLVASPSDARRMLLDLQAAGHGSVKLFAGKRAYDFSKEDEPLVAAARTIDAVLADADLMAESQRAQTKIDTATEVLRRELALADDELTAMPFLFERIFARALAYQPGTVNLLHVGDAVAAPKPFGPRIDGADPFETDLVTRLGALGLDVHFVDNWDLYHIEMGEVHCGTNVDRSVDVAWWESGR